MCFPWAPNVLFWAQCCWKKLFVLLIKIILVVVSCSVRSYIVPFFYPLSIFVLGCQCASRILPTQTKYTPWIDDNWQLYWQQLSLTNPPWAPNVLFWAQCCWKKLFKLLIKIILVVFRYSVKSVAPYIVFLVAPGSSYLPSVERSALPYDSSVRGPRKFAICGESGGIERFQLAKRVLCASIAERERESCLCFFSNK